MWLKIDKERMNKNYDIYINMDNVTSIDQGENCFSVYYGNTPTLEHVPGDFHEMLFDEFRDSRRFDARIGE